MVRYSQIINIMGLIVGLIALNLTIYGQFDDPQTGIVFVFGILGFVALYFIVSYLITNLMERLNQIQNNKESISDIQKGLNKINENLNNIKGVTKIDTISFLEKRIK